MNALPLILTVFVACAVEAVEALTIVLAAGITREWRSTFQGMAVPDMSVISCRSLRNARSFAVEAGSAATEFCR